MAQWHATMPYSGNGATVCASNKGNLFYFLAVSVDTQLLNFLAACESSNLLLCGHKCMHLSSIKIEALVVLNLLLTRR